MEVLGILRGWIRSIGSTESKVAIVRRRSRTAEPNVAHDLADGTAIDIVEFAGWARPY